MVPNFINLGGLEQVPRKFMKSFFFSKAITLLAVLFCFSQAEEAYVYSGNPKDAASAYKGTETDLRLKQEFSFLAETIADLQDKGAAGQISYIWNPSHSIVVFFSVSPPSGSYHCKFWAYQKQQDTWVNLGEYDFCTRYGSDLDWNRVRITIQDEGYYFSFPDGDVIVTHFFCFKNQQDVFYYRMEK